MAQLPQVHGTSILGMNQNCLYAVRGKAADHYSAGCVRYYIVSNSRLTEEVFGNFCFTQALNWLSIFVLFSHS